VPSGLPDESLLPGVPAIHAQSCRFAGFEWRREGLHAVSSHKNSSVADVEEYTEARDVVNHANDGNQILEILVSHSFRSDPRFGSTNRRTRPQGAQAISEISWTLMRRSGSGARRLPRKEPAEEIHAARGEEGGQRTKSRAACA
jgi:hypothetical protein